MKNKQSKEINEYNEKVLSKIQQAFTHYPVDRIEDEAVRLDKVKQSIIHNSNRFEKNLYFLNSSQAHTANAVQKGVRYYTFENDLDTLGNGPIKGVDQKMAISGNLGHSRDFTKSKMSLNQSKLSHTGRKRPNSSYVR